MEEKSTRVKRIITGGLILIALGVLIILHNAIGYSLAKSWPILLIVIAFGALLQSGKDIGGWIIGAVGIIFLLKNIFDADFGSIGAYLLPLILILLGVSIIAKHYRKRQP